MTPRRSALLLSAFLLAGCVGSELEIPANHPGHPGANTGKLTFSSALGRELDLRRDDSTADASGHAGHEHHSDAAPREQAPQDAAFTCPMHPEIVRGEPGACPICGMKLVPKKEGK